MDVDQRPGGKGGKTDETDRDADGLSFCEGQKDQGGRMFFEARDQISFDILRQGLTVAHGVPGIGVDHGQHAAPMGIAIQVGFDNLQFLLGRFILHGCIHIRFGLADWGDIS